MALVWAMIIGIIHGGQINYGRATMLDSEIWIADQLDQPVESYRGNRETFFLDEANLITISSLLPRDASEI